MRTWSTGALLIVLLAIAFLPQAARPTSTRAAPAAACSAPIEPVPLVDPIVVTNCTQAGLQAALDQGGQITFDCGPNPVVIAINTPLQASATVDTVIDGQGRVTLDGGGTTRILVKPFTPGSENDKSKGNDLTIQNMRFVNGRAPAATKTRDSNARGGALWVTSPGTRLHIINTSFENNRTTSIDDEDNQGGAIYAANIYETVIAGSTFTNNIAGSGGAFGGIATGLIVYNSTFIGNAAADTSEGGIVRGHGGALHLDGVTNSFNPESNRVVDICGSRFEGNTAVRGGGAIKVTVSDSKGTKATYARSSFIDNRLVGVPPAEGHGGAIYHIEDDIVDEDAGRAEDNIEIRETTFAGNHASKQGGGVWISVNGQGRVINSTFTENTASVAGSDQVGQGGGLIVSRGLIDITSSTFAENFATFQGGAIFSCGLSDNCRTTLTRSLFYRNRLDPTHTNPVTTEWQGYHTNRPLINGGGNLQYPLTKEPDFDNKVNNLIVEPESAILVADPLLGPLEDNGGPTATRALLIGSPAIDAGDTAPCPATDQRGVARPQGSGCDIGAYELVLSLSLSPAFVEAGTEGFVLTVRGHAFTTSSRVLWNGTELPTTFVDSTTLLADVAAEEVVAPAEVAISVSDSDLPPVTFRVLETVFRSYLPGIVR